MSASERFRGPCPVFWWQLKVRFPRMSLPVQSIVFAGGKAFSSSMAVIITVLKVEAGALADCMLRLRKGWLPLASREL